MRQKLIALLSVITLVFLPIPAFAEHGGGHGGPGGGGHGGSGYGGSGYYHGGRYPHGAVVHRLPAGYISLMVAGAAFLFCEGLFYRYSPAGYVVVQPPVGAVVPMMPPGYTTVFINGMPYYYYGYTYYTMAPGGYVVAAPPAVPMAPPAVAPVAYPAPQAVAPQAAQLATPPQTAPQAANPPSVEGDNPDTFEIHIPNGDGSFTLVTLKKTEKGFLGPQGEFYQDHPTVDQLKERYVKNKK